MRAEALMVPSNSEWLLLRLPHRPVHSHIYTGLELERDQVVSLHSLKLQCVGFHGI